VTVKLARLGAVILLMLSLCFAVGLYLPGGQQLLKSWERALGGDHHLHLLAGSLIPLTLSLLGRIYRYSSRQQLLAWGCCLALFAIDEYVQRYSQFRSSNVEDFLYSAAGWAAGLVIYLLLCWRLR
jgi:hypothetical protein